MARRTKNEIIKAERAQFSKLTPKDQRELVWWLMAMTDPSRQIRWTESLKTICAMLISSPTPEAASVFWVRLFAVLVEIARANEPWECDECGVKQDPDGSPEERSAWVEATNREREADVLGACQDLRREFSDDELLLIEWKRDDEAHVFLRGYDLKPRNGRLDGFHETALQGPVHVDRLRQIAIDHENARAEVEIAVGFARRAAPYVDRILDRLNSFEIF